MSLMLHKGAEEVSRKDLALYPAPEHTNTWAPVSHSAFADMVEEACGRYGLEWTNEKHGITADAAQYYGLAMLEGASIRTNSKFALTIGLRGSYNKRLPRGVGIGSHVFICDNGAFTADNMIKHKQTANIMDHLPQLIDGIVTNTVTVAGQQEIRFDRYQSEGMDDTFAHHLIVEMLRQGAVNTSRIEKVVQEWHEPSYDHGPKTAWRLFNAGTEALKSAPINDVPKRTIALQNVLDSALGLTLH